MVYRVYVERKPELASAERAFLEDIQGFLGIRSVHGVRIIKRYDVEGIDEELLERCKRTVFSEPQTDVLLPQLEDDGAFTFAVEYLPGQFDQRADSAAQCIQLISRAERPVVRTATVYKLYGEVSPMERELIAAYLINPIESREASLELPQTLSAQVDAPSPPAVVALRDSSNQELIRNYGLAMNSDDLDVVRRCFDDMRRDPTLTDIRVIDTYWSDHCRHTTFRTIIDNVEFNCARAERTFAKYLRIRKELGVRTPVTLMDMATIASKHMRRRGLLAGLDESDEINACTVKIKVDVRGNAEDWLLLFKNETHNHPTEIEPFGGAATCIGGAIRDPLSGRSYVYQAMRISGASNPLEEAQDTLDGKLPQRRIARTSAAGYSSYGNQVGVATGMVDEAYHPGYVAKHLELGAVIGAVPAANVRRECPAPGDIVVLIGGRTDRDGCGGATGSSMAHDTHSLAECGAQVQKGNAPEERKLQRLFRMPEAARLIKRCNDFGAGGVSVAIGELADGLDIDLDAVLLKYEGLDSTELAISESQERMAVVVAPEDAERFIALAHSENLDATAVARVTDTGRMTMRWRGNTVADIPRQLLDSNGAERRANAVVSVPLSEKAKHTEFVEGMLGAVSSLATCSKRGLSELFDSTIGAGTVLAPFGGTTMRTPIQAMAALIPASNCDTNTCSIMTYAFDPHLSSRDPYLGAYCAVISSVAKLIAAGGSRRACYLTLQEYFEKLGAAPERWGKPLAAMLGALEAQLALDVAAIGGKDSMSGSFEESDVPPTLVSFAVCTADAANVISPEFKRAGSNIAWLTPQKNADGLFDAASVNAAFDTVERLIAQGKVLAAYAPQGGVAEGLAKMAFGNNIGVRLADDIDAGWLFEEAYGSFLLELENGCSAGKLIGVTTTEPEITLRDECVSIDELYAAHRSTLEPVYPTQCQQHGEAREVRFTRSSPVPAPRFASRSPKVLIPVFPGTNCEYDSARAVELAGGEPKTLVIRNRTPRDIEESVSAFASELRNSHVLFIPGGFSGGDEPDGSARLITSFMRNAAVSDAVHELLCSRDGLILGICNGFQALVKLGLVPYGRILPPTADSPTLTYNSIGRHQSRLVYTRVASNKSPWLMHRTVGDTALIPVSHGEGRFVCSADMLRQLARDGQIATQYCDARGAVSMDIDVNPNGSAMAIEGITSPDGRVFGKMAHSERYGRWLYKNLPSQDDSGIFTSAMKYFAL
ncbi:MAG: phosphoribosylformylglycinamidine synthase [Clostridia bacterium]|nr:phosphoribosylformylglycinamidine synthase [Clostridia bacterium]